MLEKEQAPKAQYPYAKQKDLYKPAYLITEPAHPTSNDKFNLSLLILYLNLTSLHRNDNFNLSLSILYLNLYSLPRSNKFQISREKA